MNKVSDDSITKLSTSNISGAWDHIDLGLGLPPSPLENFPANFDALALDPDGSGSGYAVGLASGNCPYNGFFEIYYANDTPLAQSFDVSNLYLRVWWYESKGTVYKMNTYWASGGSYSASRNYILGVINDRNPSANDIGTYNTFLTGYQAACP